MARRKCAEPVMTSNRFRLVKSPSTSVVTLVPKSIVLPLTLSASPNTPPPSRSSIVLQSNTLASTSPPATPSASYCPLARFNFTLTPLTLALTTPRFRLALKLVPLTAVHLRVSLAGNVAAGAWMTAKAIEPPLIVSPKPLTPAVKFKLLNPKLNKLALSTSTPPPFTSKSTLPCTNSKCALPVSTLNRFRLVKSPSTSVVTLVPKSIVLPLTLSASPNTPPPSRSSIVLQSKTLASTSPPATPSASYCPLARFNFTLTPLTLALTTPRFRLALKLVPLTAVHLRVSLAGNVAAGAWMTAKAIEPPLIVSPKPLTPA